MYTGGKFLSGRQPIIEAIRPLILYNSLTIFATNFIATLQHYLLRNFFAA
jgi:hypothetical protein